MIAAMVLAAGMVGDPTARVCTCQVQCDAMWAEATAAISRLSGMRLRLASDTAAETYIPRVGLFGIARKSPMGEGRYLIQGDIGARPDSGSAADLAARGTGLFHQAVERVALENQCGGDAAR